MAGPTAGVTSAAQIAQQKLQQDPAAQQQLKQGSSRFDQAMARRADAAPQAGGVNATQATTATQATQATQKVQTASQVQKVGHAGQVDKLRPDAATTRAAQKVDEKPSTSKVAEGLSRMLGDMEKGQGILDKLINQGLAGKNKLDNNQLLALQAGMYKYTQELELTGKVVEKATTGLKDTLKTQV